MPPDTVESPTGSVRSEISTAMVRIKRQSYGRGPTKAKTYLNDDYVFCVMEGGLTTNEETLLEAGEEDLVRSYRLRFQEVMTAVATDAVEEITRRKVLTYHSQILFDPTRVFEIFVLEPEPAADSDGDRLA